jgi:hypothetical protein
MSRRKGKKDEGGAPKGPSRKMPGKGLHAQSRTPIGEMPEGGRSLDGGAYTADPDGQAEKKRPAPEEIAELQPLNPVFAWFEGGDRLQFGDLCPNCPPIIHDPCQQWRRDTLDGVLTEKPTEEHDCLYYLKWKSADITVDKLTKDELAEGPRNKAECPSCGGNEMATSVRTASEYGTRMNPRAIFLKWCKCGYFSAEMKDLVGDKEHCVFCGGVVNAEYSTVSGSNLFHIDCFLRLRFFIAMSEMMKVAQGYAATGKTLGLEESTTALRKTMELVKAFRISGNRNLLGVNRVIHWLEGESPIVTSRAICRTRDELKLKLEDIFRGEAERSVGVDALEDAFIIYDSPDEVRWITHGAYEPARSIEEFLHKYMDRALEGKWAEIEKRELKKYRDGVCILCGNISRSHRIASGVDENNIYVCHHCWTGAKPEKK